MKKGILGAFATLVVMLGMVWFVASNRYNMYDWAKLQNYSPSATVSALASDSGMSDKGRKLFYINDPQLVDKKSFKDKCQSAEQTIVLGCYTGTNIYVYKVDEARLNGVEEVTSAHEMLHVAYQRLSLSEKTRINTLLQSAYERVKDKQLAEVMASYQKTEPGQQDNELHSILGTEYANLGPELEEYYAKYFVNREKVVKLANDYKKVFEDIIKQVEQYDAELSLRKTEITQREADLVDLAKQLEAQKARMDAFAKSGQINLFNAQISSYNAGVNRYNNGVAEVKLLIEQYNNIIVVRNSLVVQQQGLAKSLDSRIESL